MRLEQRAKLLGECRADIPIEHDAVWISNAGGAEGEFASVQSDFFHEDIPWFSGNWYVLAEKGDLSHFDLDFILRFEHPCLHLAAERIQPEWFCSNQAQIVHIPAENPQSIAAFFRFTAIGIEDPQGCQAIGRNAGFPANLLKVV
jgi:hypothetical protein